MAHTIVIKLNKPAHQFQAGDSMGFGIRGGVQYYDRQTKQKEWTNYEAAIFARNPQQIQFYQNALVEGAIVEVSGQQQKIRQFEGQNGLVMSIELLDAKLGYIHAPSGVATQGQSQQAPQQQQRPPQQQMQAPMQRTQTAPGFQQPQAQSAQQAPSTAGWNDDMPGF